MSAEEFYRFEERHTLGVVNSLECNAVYDVTGKYAICGALQNIYVWNLRTGELFAKWIDFDNNSLACHIRRSPFDPDLYAVGYVDGSIRIWSFSDHNQPKIVFKGHKAAVTCFAFSMDGTRLASGAKDSDIVLWDLNGESGLFRLLGHSNTVTAIDFMPNAPNYLISASKDTLVKVWDLSTQHCIETVVVHRSEVTSVSFFDSGAILLTAGAEHHIKIFAVDYSALERKLMTPEASSESTESLDVLKCLGHVDRVTKERVINLSCFDQDHFGLLSADKSVELWRVRSMEEIKKKINRRVKRAREKAKTTGQVEISEKAEPSDLLQSLLTIRPKHKSSFVDFVPKKQRLLLSHNDNTLVEYTFELPEREGEGTRVGTYELIRSIDSPGHRTEVRSVAISHSRELFATASAEVIKVWRVEGGACVITLDSEQIPTCISFIQDDQYILTGTKEGTICLYEIASGTMVLSKKAHDSAVSTLHIHPKSLNSFITGSNDKSVHFWTLKRSSRTDELKFKHIRTLQLTESVICVRYSPDARFLAVSLFDMTVKVFFEDSLKFHLSFYGHKLPVTTLDFSHDSKFLLTGSHDKNVKLWAMEFGDCRRSLFAHNEPIQSVRFVYSNSGYDFITAGRDGVIKYWTMKEYELLQKMTSHYREIWAMEVAGQGEGFGRPACCLLVSASHDRSIRVWEQTGEQIFLEEERERQMEEIIEHSMLEDNQHGDKEPQRAMLRTVAAMKAGERLYEFIEEADKEREKWDMHHSTPGSLEPTPGPLLAIIGKDRTPAELVYWAVLKVPTPDLEQALLCLPFLHVKSLLFYIREWIDNISHIVLATRVLNSLIRLFFNQMATDLTLKTLMIDIRRIHKGKLQEVRDLLGINLVMINDILKEHKEQHTAAIFEKLTISQFSDRKHQLDEH